MSDRARSSWEQVFRGAPIAMQRVSADGALIDVNDAWEALTGYARVDVVGRPASVLSADDRGSPFDDRSRLGGTAAFELQRADGARLAVEADASAEDEDGQTVWVIRDVTERERAKAALDEREAQLRRVIERSPDLIFVHREGTIVFANEVAAAVLGAASAEDVVGEPLPQALLADDEPRLFEARVLVRQRRDAPSSRPPGRTRSSYPPGAERTLEVARVGIHFDGAPSEIVIARDLTEHRALQTRLAHADRLATVGTLAAGVAHEINNPLTYVLHYVERVHDTLRRAESAGGGLSADAAHVLGQGAMGALEGCARVRDIVSGLKTFGRVDDGPRAAFDVNRAVRSALKMAGPQLRARVETKTSLSASVEVRAHEGRLSQVFVNLLVNAAQSMQRGRRGVVSVRSWGEGDRVFVSVTDNGKGIEADHLGRLFEPFFSTKTDTVGTGLGLWICRDIVHDQGGHIEVESEVGRGSSFTVVLPSADTRVEITTDPPNAPLLVDLESLAAKRILVVDDEPALRSLLAEVLSMRGEVLTAASGLEARALLEAGEVFDAIVCDLMMPGMSGLELYRWIGEHHPALRGRMVFMSGAAFTPRMREFLSSVQNPRLDKPFRVRDLEGVLDTLLGPTLLA